MKQFLKALCKKLFAKSSRTPTHVFNLKFNDLLRMTPFFETLPLRNKAFQKKKKLTLHWIIPDFGIGSGGHMTIFRMIHFLEKFGHKNTIWIFAEDLLNGSPENSKKVIGEHFISLNADVYKLPEDLTAIQGDAVIATEWRTAYPVRHVQNVSERFYFVQDFEPQFFPMGTEYKLAEETYRFGYKMITAGKWLQKKMTDYTAVKSIYSFPLAYDPLVYLNKQTNRDANRIAFYVRYGTNRRAVELGLMALDLVFKINPDITVDFFGEDLSFFQPEYKVNYCGILSHSELAELYNKATVGLVFSCTNYSLIPQEMMACGLPVIDLKSDTTQTVFDEGEMYLTEPSPMAIAESILEVLSSNSKQEDLRKSGYAFVKDLSWEQSAKDVETAIFEGLCN